MTRVAAIDTRGTLAFGLSLLLHAALVTVVVLQVPPRPPALPARDVWAGDTVDIESVLADPGPARDPLPQGGAPAAVEPATPAEPPEPAQPVAGAAAVAPAAAAPPPAAEKPAATDEDDYGEQWIRIEDQLSEDDLADSNEAAERPESPEPAAPPMPRALPERVLAYEPPTPIHNESEAAALEPVDDAPAAREFGGVDEAAKERDLVRAFVRAIPAANTRDPAWDRLALGSAGSTTATIFQTTTGMVGQTAPDQEVPAHLERLVARTLRALQAVRRTDSPRAQRATLKLAVRVTQRPPQSGPLELGFEAPRADWPGRAYFLLPSGRFVDVTVEVVSRTSGAAGR